MNQRDALPWQELRRLRDSADRWRAIVRGVPPWQAAERDGEIRLWNTREGGSLGHLEGHWAPGVAAYLNAIHPYAGVQLAELLWLVAGHGNMIRIQQHAVDLFKTMGLADDDVSGRTC